MRFGAATRCPGSFVRAAATIQAQCSEHKQTFCLVGPNRINALSVDDQPAWDEQICPPLGTPELAAPALRCLMARLERVDVVHCWSIRMLRLARLVCGRKTAYSVVLADLPVFEGTAGLVHRHLLRNSTVVVLCDADRDSLGDAIGTDYINHVRVSPIPISKKETNPALRAATRHDLQLADHEVAILIAGDLVSTIDVGRIEFLLSSCTIMGLNPIALIPRGVPRIEELRRHLRKTARFDTVRFVHAPTSTLLQGVDMALLASGTFNNRTSPGLAALGIASAHAHGVPCIAPASIAPASLYPDEDARACLAFNSSLPEVARILARLVEDDELRARAAKSVIRPFETSDRVTQFKQAVSSAWECSINRSSFTHCPA